jgi:DNA-binding MarR family transcriptional regulator
MPSKSTRKRSTATDDAAVMAQDQAPVGDTAPVSASLAGTPALPPSVPDTATTRGVWAALLAEPGSTAASLADAAGIGRPTAAKTLAVLKKAGLVTRAEGGRDGSKRLPDQWQSVVRNEAAGASDGESTDAAGPALAEVPVPVAEAGSPEQAEPQPADSADDDASAPVASPVPEAEQAGTVEEEKGQPAQRPKARSSARTGKPATAPKTDAGTSRLGSGQLRNMVLQFLRDHGGEDFSPSAMGKALARSSGAISNACDRLQADGAVLRTSDKPRKFRIAKS